MAAPLLGFTHVRKGVVLAAILVLATAGPSWSQGRTARARGGDGGGGERARHAQGQADRAGDRRGGTPGEGARTSQPREPREPRRAASPERTERRGSGGELPRVNGSAFAESVRQGETAATQRRDNPAMRYAVPRNGEARQAVRRYDFPDGTPDGQRYGSPDRPPQGRRVYNNNNFVYVAPGRPYGYRAPWVSSYRYSPYPRYRYHNRVFGWYGVVGGYAGYPYSGYGGYGFGYPTGELHLDVQPSWAQVYVDGYYAGTVDDFDGFGQALRLEEGPYTIEIVAPGFEPLTFDVRVQRGQQITYQGDLIPEGSAPPLEPQQSPFEPQR